MVNGTPFLLSLGLSESLTALVWLAGPICGTFVQPIVGAYSDQCTHSWGRRKPYIIGGTAAACLCLLSMAYSQDFFILVALAVGVDETSSKLKLMVQAAAMFWVYALNTSLQPLQSGIRSLIVEQANSEEQVTVNAWASRFTALGNVFMCSIGFTGFPEWVAFGHDRFHSLTTVAVTVLILTVSITCMSITEPLMVIGNAETRRFQASICSKLLQSLKRMPPTVQNVCYIQFVSWLGWFPFLFYNSTFIGDLVIREAHLFQDMDIPVAQKDPLLWKEAVRMGNLSGLTIALVTLLVAMVAPLTTATFSSSSQRNQEGEQVVSRNSLYMLWASSQILFTTCMLSTFLITNHISGIILMSLVGASWAIAIWVPYALIGEALKISQDQDQDGDLASSASNRNGTENGNTRSMALTSRPEVLVYIKDAVHYSPILEDHHIAAENSSNSCDTFTSHSAEIATVLGLHNMAIAIPQIIAALVSSAVFYTMAHFKREDGLGWVLRTGGLAGVASAVMIVYFANSELAAFK